MMFTFILKSVCLLCSTISRAWLLWQLQSPTLESNQETVISLLWASLAPSVGHEHRQWVQDLRLHIQDHIIKIIKHMQDDESAITSIYVEERVFTTGQASSVTNWSCVKCPKKVFHHLLNFPIGVTVPQSAGSLSGKGQEMQQRVGWGQQIGCTGKHR